MKKSEKRYKIVASDLDGTLLGLDQRASQENLDAIREITELGVEFIPATGRCLGEMPGDVSDCPDVRYIITSDGAAVWDKAEGRVALSRYIPKDLVKFMLDVTGEYNTFPIVHEGGEAYYDKARYTKEYMDLTRVNDYFRDLIARTNIGRDDFYSYLCASDKVELFCIFFSSDEDLKKCADIMLETGRLSVAQSAAHNLEIYSIDGGKGNTLKALAEQLSADISEVIAVGDSTNDSSLIATAGLGLAVENACPELKEIADEVICHFSEHSARYILENYIK